MWQCPPCQPYRGDFWLIGYLSTSPVNMKWHKMTYSTMICKQCAGSRTHTHTHTLTKQDTHTLKVTSIFCSTAVMFIGLLAAVVAFVRATSTSWPPKELRKTLESKEWYQIPVKKHLPRRCQDRFQRGEGDPCFSPSNAPRQRVCTMGLKGWCDNYSVGSGYCLVFPSDNPERNLSKLAPGARTDHCSSLLQPANESDHMFLCPLQAPIAVMMNPKAGSNSLSSWLQFMTTKHRPAGLVKNHFTFLNSMGIDWPKVVDSLTWIRSLAGGGLNKLTPKLRRELLLRLRFEILYGPDGQVSKGHSRQLLPPGWCVPCCTSASGRLVLLVVRNPFRRVQSYFRHRFLDNPKKAPLVTWNKFPIFLQLLSDHRRNQSFWHVPMPRPLDHLCLTHTLSFSDIIEDPKWSGEAREAVQTRIFPVRLETLAEDFLQLQMLLCRSFSYCRTLPPLPKAVPQGWRPYMPEKPPPLEKLWTTAMREQILTMFRSDFAELGYSQHFLTEKPVTLPRIWHTLHGIS